MGALTFKYPFNIIYLSRASHGFDRGLAAGEAIRSRYVKPQN